jgi:hypothetical protein
MVARAGEETSALVHFPDLTLTFGYVGSLG